MTHLLLFLSISLFGFLMNHFAARDVSNSPAYGLGIMMLLGYSAGRLARIRGLPSITGCLAAGMLLGPFGFRLITHTHVEGLQLINGLALSVIALTAGGEIRLRSIRTQMKTIVSVLFWQSIMIVIGITLSFTLLAPFFKTFPLSGSATLLSAGLLTAIIATASSPSTTLAVIVESGSRSTTTDLILGIVMLKDIIILFLFCFGLNLARAFSSGDNLSQHKIWNTFYEIAFSLIVGIIIGLVIVFYLRYVRRNQVVFILALCFFSYEVFEPLGLHPLLIMMAAGFLVANLSREGDPLMRHLESISPPVYVLFFTLTGAGVRLDLMKQVGFLAAGIVLLRMAFKWMGTWIGVRFAHGDRDLRRHGWTAFISQAGLSLGMAKIIENTFPSWGKALSMLIVTVIFINQIIGPLTLKWFLDREPSSPVT